MKGSERAQMYGLAALLLGGALWMMGAGDWGKEWWYRSDAERSISLAVEACGTNRFEFQHRLMNAKEAINKMPLASRMELMAKMENSLRYGGCGSR